MESATITVSPVTKPSGQTANAPSPLLRLFPSITDFAFLLPFLALLTALPYAKTLLRDADTGWHIRTGDWILQHRQVPYKDLFSFTMPDANWFAWEWGWDVLFSLIHSRWGLSGVLLANAIILGLVSALLYRLVRRRAGNDMLAFLISAMAICASSLHWLARPHLGSSRIAFSLRAHSALEGPTDRLDMEGGLQLRLLTMKQYHRHLPHWDAPGLPVFVTWRLRGSLPAERVFLPEHLTSGEAFLIWDRLLDKARSGSVYLRQPDIAALVQEQLHHVASKGFRRLHAGVIMPNHVHLLCTPHIELPNLMRRVKGPTAYRANRLLNRTGEVFWQEEFFDRMIRDDQEFERVRRYIEWNPVRAALATRPEDFAWSSTSEGGLQPASGLSSTTYESFSEAEPRSYRGAGASQASLQSGAEAPRGLKPAPL